MRPASVRPAPPADGAEQHERAEIDMARRHLRSAIGPLAADSRMHRKLNHRLGDEGSGVVLDPLARLGQFASLALGPITTP